MKLETIKYDGCTYQCYLKQIKSRTGKQYYRAFCRREDRKCVPGKVPVAKPVAKPKGIPAHLQAAAQEVLTSVFLMPMWNNRIDDPGEKHQIHTKKNIDKASIAQIQHLSDAKDKTYLVAHPNLINYPDLLAAGRDLLILLDLRTSNIKTLPPLSLFDFEEFQILLETPLSRLDAASFQKQLEATGARELPYDNEKYCELMKYYIKAGQTLSPGAERDLNKICGFAPKPAVPLKAKLINAPTPKDAKTLRDKADAMMEQIEAKKNPAVAQQRVTARRARQVERAQLQAEALENIQTELYTMADMIEAGTLPAVLWNVKSKADIERIQYYGKYEYDIPTEAKVKRESYAPAKKELQRTISAFKKMGITRKSQIKDAYDALTAMLKPKTPEEKAAKTIEAMERELIGRKIPGYFPTPTEIAEEMVHEADIQPDMTVLEPSAGKGNIAEVIRKRHPNANLVVMEIVEDLQKILRAKGFKIISYDFLDYEGQKFDRIIQNPPFEKMQDITHFRKAYEMLKPGGRLVSLMSEGPFFRTFKVDVAFREFLKEHGGQSTKLSPGAFQTSERPTGVQARMVVIDKPKEKK